MAQLKKNTARLILNGISILGILFAFICILSGVIGLLSIRREDLTSLCLSLSLSVILLVVGPWLARDSYLMLRGRAFEAIKAISGLLALVIFALIESLLVGVEDAFADMKGFVAVYIVFIATWLPSVASAALVYFVCTKLLIRLVEVAYGPQDMSGKQDSVGNRDR